MAKCSMSPKSVQFLIGTCSVVSIICLTVLLIFSSLFKQLLTKQFTLEEGTELTNLWKDIPIPIYEKFYFFNITNAEEFLKNNQPLNITEVGPYIYVGKWVKNYLKWNSNGTVSYRELRTYQFAPEMSAGSQDDVINTLNGPMILSAAFVKDYNDLIRNLLSLYMGLENEKIIIQRSIRQLIYEGYNDPIIKLAPLIKPDIPFKDGIFAWFYGKNATDDGLYTVYTGKSNSSLTNIITQWNGYQKLPFWKGDYCNELKGTTLETGPQLPDHPESYSFFQSLFCRTVTLKFVGDEMHYGVLTKRFKPTPMLFANSSENPDNACFEINKEHASGVFDYGPCQFGAPVFVSFPHFYMADPIYLKNINGLQPNEEKHGTHLDIWPEIGFTVDGIVRIQMNVEIERIPGIVQLNNAPEGIFPIFWLELQIALDESWYNYIKRQLTIPKIIAYTLCSILFLVSLIIIIVVAIILKKRQSKGEKDPLLKSEKQGITCQQDNYQSTNIIDVSESKYVNCSVGITPTSHIQIHPSNSDHD